MITKLLSQQSAEKNLVTMMRLLLILLSIVPLVATAEDLENEIGRLTKEIAALRNDRSKSAADEYKLEWRLQKLPPNAPEAEAVKSELAETRQLLSVLAEREHIARKLMRKLQDSPLRRVTKAIAGDNRRPTKTDVSGVWTSGLSLVGYTMQLEQLNESITGQGFYWGCLGAGETFSVSGSYRNDVLSLTFRVSLLKQTRHTYGYTEERGLPCFKKSRGKYEERITPIHELR